MFANCLLPAGSFVVFVGRVSQRRNPTDWRGGLAFFVGLRLWL